jgi:hypothetical protein
MKKRWVFILSCFLTAVVFYTTVSQAKGTSPKDVKDAKEKAISSSKAALTAASAAAGSTQTVKIPVVSGRNFITHGISSEHTLWLTIPENVDLTAPVRLVYHLNCSQTLSPTSNATVLFNDEPLESFVLKSEGVDTKISREVYIPLRLIKRGVNSLAFRFYTIANLLSPCQDLTNPSIWAVIFPESFVELTYKSKGIERINFFPEPFVRRGEMNRFPLAIVLPQNPSFEELRAAAVIVQYFGMLEPFDYASVELILGPVKPEVLNKYNLISIGSLQSNIFAAEIKKRVGESVLAELDDKKGLVAVMESSSTSGRQLLAVTGKDQTLFRSAQVMTDANLVKAMDGFYQVIDVSKPFKPDVEVHHLDNPSLENLGYFSTKLAGIFQASAAFKYTPPPHWELQPGTAFVLDISYSPVLNKNISVFTVTINDQTIQSFKVSGNEKARESFLVRIPDKMLNDPYFYTVITTALAVTSEGQVQQPMWCMEPNYESAWIIIHDSSRFHTPHSYIRHKNFQTFPVAFFGENSLKPVKIVVPGKASDHELKAAFNTIYLISSLAPYKDNPPFEILRDYEVTEQTLKNFDLVLIGSGTNNALIGQIGKTLPLPLNPNTGKPVKSEIEILPQFLEEVAVLQIGSSLWNPQQNVLVINASKDELANEAVLKFLDREISSKWKGNIVLVNDKDQWYSYQYGAEEKRKKRHVTGVYLKFWIGSILAVSFLAGFLIYWRRRHGLRHPF